MWKKFWPGQKLEQAFGLITVSAAAIAIAFTGDFGGVDSSTRITKSANLSEKQKITRKSIPQTLNPTPWMEQASGITNLPELLKITSNKEKLLVQSLMDDEFDNGKPFLSLSSYYPLVALLGKGVRSYQRSTFRTQNYRGADSYDLVTYDVIHSDGTHSEIMAYNDKKADPDLNSRTLELPMKYVVFSLYESGQSRYYNLYRDNELEEHGSLELARATHLVADRVNGSVPFMAVTSR